MGSRMGGTKPLFPDRLPAPAEPVTRVGDSQSAGTASTAPRRASRWFTGPAAVGLPPCGLVDQGSPPRWVGQLLSLTKACEPHPAIPGGGPRVPHDAQRAGPAWSA
jgi:hypothetical protein